MDQGLAIILFRIICRVLIGIERGMYNIVG